MIIFIVFTGLLFLAAMAVKRYTPPTPTAPVVEVAAIPRDPRFRAQTFLLAQGTRFRAPEQRITMQPYVAPASPTPAHIHVAPEHKGVPRRGLIGLPSSVRDDVAIAWHTTKSNNSAPSPRQVHAESKGESISLGRTLVAAGNPDITWRSGNSD